jgi:hypothetical protein
MTSVSASASTEPPSTAIKAQPSTKPPAPSASDSVRMNMETTSPPPAAGVDETGTRSTVTDNTNATNPNPSPAVASSAQSGSSQEQTISYSAERIIGNGSFGVVFQAAVVETGEIVAIKKVLQDKRFKNRELQIMRQLVKDPHSNIVALKHCFYSQVRTSLFLCISLAYTLLIRCGLCVSLSLMFQSKMLTKSTFALHFALLSWFCPTIDAKHGIFLFLFLGYQCAGRKA